MTNIITLNQPEVHDQDPAINEHALKLCRKLELNRQVLRLSETRSVERDFAKCLLSADEFRVWSAYCPTRYSMEEGVRSIRYYDFDIIPLPVLELWHRCKDEYPFDSFSICTTERTPNYDPILLGHYKDKVYLLARWGTESPGDVSFDAVCRSFLPEMRESYHNVLKAWFPLIRRLRVVQEIAKREALLYSNPVLRRALENLGYDTFTTPRVVPRSSVGEAA